jgi:hypothetical protein
MLIQWFAVSPRSTQNRLLADVSVVLAQLQKTSVLQMSETTLNEMLALFQTCEKCVQGNGQKEEI